MSQSEFEKNYRIIVERIFNNWQNLRLAVEHGMGGRDGQNTAIQIMDYTYKYLVGNEHITPGELQDVIEELMDQEFNTFCDDYSIQEISRNLVRYKGMSLQGQYAAIEVELEKLPKDKEWLRPDIKITYTPIVGEDSSSDDDDDDDDNDDDNMDCDDDDEAPRTSRGPVTRSQTQKPPQEDFVEPEDGWTTVRRK